MANVEQHLDNLIRHINLVRESCILLGKKLIASGRLTFGKELILRGFKHDLSKFTGIEWKYLHNGKDTPLDGLNMAVEQHNTSNDHHPEYSGGFEYMSEIQLAEMSCDILARAQEFGTDVRQWIKDKAIAKYNIATEGENYKFLMYFIDLLTENTFVKE